MTLAAPVPRVLIADDERSLRDALLRFIRSLGMEAEAFASGEEVLPRLEGCDLVITDLRMPGMDGMSLLGEVRRRKPDLPVIVLTGHATVALAVEAMRGGAANFLTKPFELDDFEQAVRAALGAPAAARARSQQKSVGAVSTRSGEVFIGESGAAQALRLLARRVAASEATVLVTGESGAGKEVVARAVHAQSKRAKMPFIAVNCGAIPEALLESELFGHVKGAFTGATQARVGRFGAADGGTLLLDEIGELPLHLQVKLLRVLQDRAYTAVGASAAQPADVRVIAATNRDLEAMVAAGQFREDLFYRLNVLTINVPPLRERGDDILQLARTFLRRAAAAEGRGLLSFDDDVALCLRRYAWPGNVRELEHAITRATVLASGNRLTLADLPIKVRAAFFDPAPDVTREEGLDTDRGAPPPPIAGVETPEVGEEGLDLNATLESVERRLIYDALERTGGNKNRAAALLRIRRTTLVEKLKRLGEPGSSRS
jgi:DNA-binding NtrC family response regulator